jgi:hypothetical protein
MMSRAFALCLLAAVPAVAVAQADGVTVEAGDGARIEVPSGQHVTWQDVIWNAPGPDGLALRFRFLAPAIGPGGGVDVEMASADMQFLCDSFALPRIAQSGPQPEQVIISLSNIPVVFGEAAPDAVQFFEAYRIEDGQCLWDMF